MEPSAFVSQPKMGDDFVALFTGNEVRCVNSFEVGGFQDSIPPVPPRLSSPGLPRCGDMSKQNPHLDTKPA
jgi:hypothetical protein